jgi:hypothetical protein
MKILSRYLFFCFTVLLSLTGCTQAAPAGERQPAPSVTATIIEPTLEFIPGYPATKAVLTGSGEGLSPFMEGASLAMSKTEPAKAVLTVAGDLPTPCHTLAFKVALPDQANQIKVSLAIVPPPARMYCDQTITPVKQEIPLGKLAPSTYTVFINGQKVGSITVP